MPFSISSMKHLVDLDEEALAAARVALGTRTIKDTVNAALIASAAQSRRSEIISEALTTLASVDFTDEDRARAWR